MTSTACLLETCRGVKASGCPQALPLSEAFVTALTQLVAHAPMPPTTPGQPLRHHAGFRLALCACPNGCARPQVADLGLTAAVSIAVSISQCTGCGCCVAACPDAAITLQNDVAVIDAHRCLGCGACHRVCPSKALTAGPVTLRAFLGGRLGRRPRLGAEINPCCADCRPICQSHCAAKARGWRPDCRLRRPKRRPQAF